MKFPFHGKVLRGGEAGDTLLSVLVAIGLIGIAGAALMMTASNSVKVQEAVRLSGQKDDLRSIFRSSLICEDDCADLVGQIPQTVGKWDVEASCAAGAKPGQNAGLNIRVRHPKYENGAWTALFPPDQSRAVCRSGIMPVPGSTAAQKRPQPGHLRVCPWGQVVTSIDFAQQTIGCIPPKGRP